MNNEIFYYSFMRSSPFQGARKRTKEEYDALSEDVKRTYITFVGTEEQFHQLRERDLGNAKTFILQFIFNYAMINKDSITGLDLNLLNIELNNFARATQGFAPIHESAISDYFPFTIITLAHMNITNSPLLDGVKQIFELDKIMIDVDPLEFNDLTILINKINEMHPTNPIII